MLNGKLSGSIVALITPMTESGEVDWKALESLIGWHLDSGTEGIVPVGTTGESATLTVHEHLEVVHRCVEVVDGRIPVIAGTGGNATTEAIHLTQEAERLGVDACLLVTPYYNRPTQEGLVHHYRAIAEAATKPLVLYNVPARTACDMQAETVARLAPIDNIIGIKEACGDPERVKAIRNLVPENFTILSGEDGQTLRMMELGALGRIGEGRALASTSVLRAGRHGQRFGIEMPSAREDQTMVNIRSAEWVGKQNPVRGFGSMRSRCCGGQWSASRPPTATPTTAPARTTRSR